MSLDLGAACSFRQVGYAYPGSSVPALRDLTFQVRAGEWLALLGANGSGKSTVARMCNALLIPTQGDCSVFGLDTRDPANLFAIRSKVGLVFQNPDNQIVASVVEEDVAFGPENLGLPPEEIESRVREALLTVGLWERRRSATYALSGGQKQRLALAGALAMNPSLLVLDEATAMIDPLGRREFVDTLVRLRSAGKTILQITHRLEEIVGADRVVVLKGGTKVFEGTPLELFSSRRDLGAMGIGVPPLVELREELLERGLISPEVPPTLEALMGALCP
ncbi:energy-coupling factor transporter ATPase [Thermanaerovibrio acidaminovorans]|jgi:energy-coupling factor transport system ATP-binding protein|uniref:ABC transporter related protein n=1 Tax=Thermanaerovibrio acidaminovorans (strain ATCC 49978 / DSM 6589 / Su883) TaxID=525903 RepID=D1B5U4_THEAS|nr:energy-coupling factor transporter ATPase [Thermanaerovibrio acidaminovorans]ACZ19385.1 ABC transporter related protein [Thermanaerovibrio acidaminovorans DSM 6589]